MGPGFPNPLRWRLSIRGSKCGGQLVHRRNDRGRSCAEGIHSLALSAPPGDTGIRLPQCGGLEQPIAALGRPRPRHHDSPVGNDGQVGPDDADNDLGDPIANWLVQNAEAIGVQYIVWDKMQWSGRKDPGQKLSTYGGSHPHQDHIHMELTLAGSRMETPFFQTGLPRPGSAPECQPIPPAGATLEVFGPCVDFRDERNANNRAWRTVAGGHSGATRWTGGWQNDDHEAEVDYTLSFEDAGTYEIEVYLDPQYAEFPTAHYTVDHADGSDVVNLDQSAGSEWVTLGSYRFEAGTSYSVNLTDHQPDPSIYSGGGSISVDAMRIAAKQGGEDGEDPGEEDPDPMGSSPDDLPGRLFRCGRSERTGALLRDALRGPGREKAPRRKRLTLVLCALHKGSPITAGGRTCPLSIHPSYGSTVFSAPGVLRASPVWIPLLSKLGVLLVQSPAVSVSVPFGIRDAPPKAVGPATLVRTAAPGIATIGVP